MSVGAMDPLPQVNYLGFDDIDGQREAIFTNAIKGFDGKSVENEHFRLEVANPHYKDDFRPTLKDEKKAVNTGGTLARKLYGQVRLLDKAGNVVEEKETVLAHIPYLNKRGMFVRNGTAWLGRNQQRLRSGIYARKGADGSYSAMINAKRGRGMSVDLDPETGVFKLGIGQSTTRLLPLLEGLGVEPAEIKQAWGEELYNRNVRPMGAHDSADMAKVVKLLGRQNEIVGADKMKDRLIEILGQTELDDEVTEQTLGERVKNLSPQALVKVTSRILSLARGESDEDVRDSQAYQSTHGPEDFIKERLQRDQAGALRKLLWNATADKSLKRVSSNAFGRNIDALFQGSGLFVGTEDINPTEIADLRYALVRTGDNGISKEAVSREARGVHPSQLGLIDPSRTPDSGSIGLELRAAGRTVKGSDNQLYTPVIDSKTGEIVYKSALQMAKRTVAFPGEMASDAKRVRALSNGQLKFVKKEDVDYVLPSPASMYARTTGAVPMFEGIKGQRLMMGVKALTQAMPLQGGEAPHVQSTDDDGNNLYEQLGTVAGAVRAKQPGRVLSVDADSIKVQYADGTVEDHELYNNYTQSRKTATHNTALVKPGDVVQPGSILAKSNYTDDKGVLAMGRNLRTGYLQFKGATFEDAIVVSESAAKKLTSEHMYKHDLDLDGIHTTGKQAYVSLYGPKYKKEQYQNLDDEGVIKEGTEVKPGDPLILAVGKKSPRAIGAVMQTERSNFSDKSQIWDHKFPGVVTDVVRTKDGIRVNVKSHNPSQLADKLSTLYGNKGVISRIIPDAEMPHDAQGNPLEVVFNSNGVVSRTNPAVVASALLGKVAAVTGKSYKLPPFATSGQMADFALEEARKAGVPELEDLYDPTTGKKLPNVFVGNSYVVKMHHVADAKLSARDKGSYDLYGAPAKGGPTGSKRIGGLLTYSLVAHGATEFLKDAKLIRGQRNDEYWRALKNGETPIMPGRSFANDHFKALLTAAGVNLREEGSKTKLAALLDADVRAKAPHEITSSETFNWETMKPIEGGLFDPKATGGADGTQWARIKLPKPVPHPLFEVPLTKILGITKKSLDNILGGQEKLGDSTGPDAIQKALAGINPDKRIEELKATVKASRGMKRDEAVKALGYMVGLQKQGVQPQDLMISEIPVIPPKFRPIARTPTAEITHDLNYLYHDLLEAKDTYNKVGEELGDNQEEYLNLYRAVKALPGMGEPIGEKSQDQQVKGLLALAIGKGDSPKNAMFQRRVTSSIVDNVGRGTVTAAPELDMDQIRIPPNIAWEVYKPFVIKRLVQSGVSAQDAVKMTRERSSVAKQELFKEMQDRPVLYDRAPALHKYSIAAAWPVLGPDEDDSIGVNYVVDKGMSLDHDGDAINIHVPVSRASVDEAKEKLLPSKSLLSASTGESHYEPQQDYVVGLWLASQIDEKKQPKVFRDKDEALRAYARGEIKMSDPIKLLKD